MQNYRKTSHSVYDLKSTRMSTKQTIRHMSAIAEGVDWINMDFRTFWESINGKGSWRANPCVIG